MKNYFLRSLNKEKICHYLPRDMWGGVLLKKVTNSEKREGEGGGLKNYHFCGDVIF